MAKNFNGVSDDEMSAKESSLADATNTAEISCHPEEDLGASGESDIPDTRKITEDPEDNVCNVQENESTRALVRRPSAPITDCDPASFELQTLDQDQESVCVDDNSYDPTQHSEV